MVARAAVIGCDHAVKGLVGNGEQRVAAEHGRQHGILVLLAFRDEVGVFLNGLQALLLAVPVADLVAQAGAQTQPLALLCNGVESAGDLAVAGVVVENRGHALLDGVDIEGGGAGTGALHHQMAVNGPPGSVQNLVKIGGVVACDGEAAGEGGVDMSMGIDESRHDHAALGVDDLCLRVSGFQNGFLAHFYDHRTLVGYSAALIIAPSLRVAGDEPPVGNKCHDTSPFEIDKRKGVPMVRNTCRAK